MGRTIINRYGQSRRIGESGMFLIERKLLTATATVDFQNIPASFKHLKIIGSARDPSANAYVGLRLRFNNDSGNNYAGNIGIVDNASFVGIPSTGSSYNLVGSLLGASIAIDSFTAFEIKIPDYTNIDHNKSFMIQWASTYANADANTRSGFAGGTYISTSVINRIYIWTDVGAGDLNAESMIDLYGIL